MRLKAWMLVLAMVAGTVGISWLGAPRAAACSCVATTTAEQAARAELVAVGTVAKSSVPPGTVVYGSDPITLTVELESLWKGTAERTVEVQTPGGSASCGLDGLAPGMRIILFAGHTDLIGGPVDGWSSLLCDGTGQFTQATADDLTAAIGEPTAPLPDPVDGDTTPRTSSVGVPGGMLIPLAVTLGVALAAGAASFLRHRHD